MVFTPSKWESLRKYSVSTYCFNRWSRDSVQMSRPIILICWWTWCTVHHHHSRMHLSGPAPSMRAKFAIRSLNTQESHHAPSSVPTPSLLAIVYLMLVTMSHKTISVSSKDESSTILLILLIYPHILDQQYLPALKDMSLVDQCCMLWAQFIKHSAADIQHQFFLILRGNHKKGSKC